GQPLLPLAEGQTLHDANVLRDESLYLWKCGGKEVQFRSSVSLALTPKPGATLRRVLGRTPDAKSRYPLYSTLPSLNAVCIHIRDSGSASESRAPTLVPHIHLPWSGGGPAFFLQSSAAQRSGIRNSSKDW